MKKLLIILGFCITSFMIGCLSFRNEARTEDPRGDAFAGAEACERCHRDIYNYFQHNAHYLASLRATEKTVDGSFTNGLNEFNVNDSQKVVMERLDNGLFQTYYLNDKVKEKYRFDIVLGRVKGESYLSWKGNKLYQLPLSYFSSQHRWSTSPGYGFNFLDYPQLRNIRKRCLECHASYIRDLPGSRPGLGQAEEFDKSSLVLTVDCERCHGPAQQHVEFQTQNPQINTAKYITTYRSLTRNQKMDACAVCHSGNANVMLRSTFDFKPGDTYSKFKIPEFEQRVDATDSDVHGNQVQLLKSSKCYMNSKMDCMTCHDPHKNSRGNVNLFAEKCLDCHNSTNHTHCKMKDQLAGDVLKANCIGCHMPALKTNAISVQVSDTLPPIEFSVRTHHIANYPQEAKKILAFIKQ
jgi:hypothetical protein